MNAHRDQMRNLLVSEKRTVKRGEKFSRHGHTGGPFMNNANSITTNAVTNHATMTQRSLK